MKKSRVKNGGRIRQENKLNNEQEQLRQDAKQNFLLKFKQVLHLKYGGHRHSSLI
jgi:hypothetical protein